MKPRQWAKTLVWEGVVPDPKLVQAAQKEARRVLRKARLARRAQKEAAVAAGDGVADVDTEAEAEAEALLLLGSQRKRATKGKKAPKQKGKVLPNAKETALKAQRSLRRRIASLGLAVKKDRRLGRRLEKAGLELTEENLAKIDALLATEPSDDGITVSSLSTASKRSRTASAYGTGTTATEGAEARMRDLEGMLPDENRWVRRRIAAPRPAKIAASAALRAFDFDEDE